MPLLSFLPALSSTARYWAPALALLAVLGAAWGALAAHDAHVRKAAFAAGQVEGKKLGRAETLVEWSAQATRNRAYAASLTAQIDTLTNQRADAAKKLRDAQRKASEHAQAEILDGDDPVGGLERCLRPLYADAGYSFRADLPADQPAGSGAPADAMAGPAEPARDRRLKPLAAYACALADLAAAERQRAGLLRDVIDNHNAVVASFNQARTGPPQ